MLAYLFKQGGDAKKGGGIWQLDWRIVANGRASGSSNSELEVYLGLVINGARKSCKEVSVF